MSEKKQVAQQLKTSAVTKNSWRSLRQFTDARIAQGRAGVSVPTEALLAFQLDHAKAQDAVHLPLDCAKLGTELSTLCGVKEPTLPMILHSQAEGRDQYLQRPDLGRCLSTQSQQRLQVLQAHTLAMHDLAVVVVDGLSSLAVSRHAQPIIKALYEQLQVDEQDWQLAPLTIVEQGRVAVGDEVGALLNARAVLVLIGERPGLSSPDSLGLYLTWAPEPGLHDARRNCISNVRAAGLSYGEAVSKLLYLLHESRRRQLSGVDLKERAESIVLP
ncbi:ethanolamine ammonia-lyase light chain [Sinobacterium caligoides]|uniref:Ethanolamine ammonia-lyase small subunit n=1 Tax=Sinobacterium caligoides TaxID=933926 RepID=A0A3N2DZW2_9GAMM|nr:ethanolamine ammonia-lyase subunit EutC [Sinobacterium caligoides]ROS05368.1 ethanolamine ammonia-lyase light chain [Sinobacterium caligoides]